MSIALGAIVFNLVPKPVALFFWTGFSCVSMIFNIMKTVYAEPRPAWVSKEITADHCAGGFGNPSGHMAMSTFIIGILYLH